MKVLIYNQNEKVRLVVGQLLKETGFNTLTTDSQENLMEKLKTEIFDIILVDVNSFNNFASIANQIIKNKKDGYLLLSIDADDKYSKTEALLNGADDYIYNDFKLEELSAKIKSVVRILTKTLENNNHSEMLSLYDLVLNPINREVKRTGNEIELTNKEFLLLEYFLRNKNRVLTRTMISEKIWDIDFITESNIVDVYINFLRAKIDKEYDRKIIRTVRSVGYIVKEEEQK